MTISINTRNFWQGLVIGHEVRGILYIYFSDFSEFGNTLNRFIMGHEEMA